MPMTQPPVIIDPARMTIRPDGVENYYWPVGQAEVMEMATTLVHAWVETLRAPLAEGNRDARLVSMMGAPLLTDLVGIFVARLLATRFARDDRQVILPEQQVDAWRAAFFGDPIRRIRIINLLRRGLQRPSIFYRLARPFADFIHPDVFIRRPLALADLRRDTIAVTVCPLTRAHVEDAEGRLAYVPLYEWFYAPSPEELRHRPLRPFSPEFRDHLIENLEAAMHGFGSQMGKMPPETLSSILDEATGWVRFYLERLELHPERLPLRLWKGTSGIIWSRMLADAVRAHGGHVTGHDHAMGANYSERTLMPFNELQANDVFVTFSAIHADLYRRLGSWQRIEKTMPQIRSVRLPPASATHAAPAAPKSPPHSVLYVTPFLAGSRIGAMPLMPTIMAIDWQARLFTMLKKMGFQVTRKPHPESIYPQPAAFETELGVGVRYERFETIMHEYDVILFDFAPQSSFGSALNSDIPVVLVDFGVTEYKPEVRAMLERRVAVVPGHYDAENRAQIDPTVLQTALNRAHLLHDPSFAEGISR